MSEEYIAHIHISHIRPQLQRRPNQESLPSYGRGCVSALAAQSLQTKLPSLTFPGLPIQRRSSWSTRCTPFTTKTSTNRFTVGSQGQLRISSFCPSMNPASTMLVVSKRSMKRHTSIAGRQSAMSEARISSTKLWQRQHGQPNTGPTYPFITRTRIVWRRWKV